MGYFFYIGGNDSQHTAYKVSQLAHDAGVELVAVGVPKTIDNDVGDSEFTLIDHTPGYGSVARYWSHIVQTANEENMGSSPAESCSGPAGNGGVRLVLFLLQPVWLIPTVRCRCRYTSPNRR